MKASILHIQKISGIAGSEKHLQDLLGGLNKDKYEVWFASLGTINHTAAERGFYAELRSAGVNVTHFQLKGLFDPFCFIKLIHFLAKHRFSLVHTHLVHADVYGILAGKLAGIKVVISTRHNDNPFRKRVPFRPLLRLLYSLTAHTITVSEFLKHFCESVERQPPAKVSTVYHGIRRRDISPSENIALRKKLNIPESSFVALSVGRLTKQKGHKFLIAAMPDLIQQFPDIISVIVGEGELHSILVEQIESLGLGSHIRMLGWADDVFPFYAMSDLYVHPSLWEGFGIVLIEAMSQGMCIVATEVGAIPEILGGLPSATIVPAGSSSDLSTAISSFWEIRKELPGLGKQSQKRQMELFALKSMISSTDAVYRFLLQPQEVTNNSHIL